MRTIKLFPVLLILALISGISQTVHAEDLIKPRLGATYTKLSDGTRSLSLALSASIDDKRVNIENAPLSVYSVNGSEKILLGAVNTNRKGKAIFSVSPKISIPKDKDGFFTFEVQYAGNTKVDAASATIHLQDVSLAISFSEKDSVKNVFIKAVAFNDKGEPSAIQDIPIELYVKRLFCLYRFGGEKTDSAGSCTVEFPGTIPGDTTGNVTIVAKILENDVYGTIETVSDFKGGKPLIIEPKPKRGLGDTDAPLWMVYTLLVLLSGVWLHVLYVIRLVIKINIIGKKATKQAAA